jgi:hypothetical protein
MSFECDRCGGRLSSKKYVWQEGYYLHLKCAREIAAAKAPRELCVCTHPLAGHLSTGECGHEINDYLGECPCLKFEGTGQFA